MYRRTPAGREVDLCMLHPLVVRVDHTKVCGFRLLHKKEGARHVSL